MWNSAYEWASEAMSFSDASAAPKTPSAPKPGPSTSMAEEALPILRRACERELPDAELLRFLRAKEWDVKRAAAAVRTTVAWRRERAEALRQLRLGPACLSRCVALMGADGCAWPVYCLRPGQLQQAAIGRDVSTEQLSAQAVGGFEALRRLLRVHQADPNPNPHPHPHPHPHPNPHPHPDADPNPNLAPTLTLALALTLTLTLPSP